jgi:hypothetical protein
MSTKIGKTLNNTENQSIIRLKTAQRPSTSTNKVQFFVPKEFQRQQILKHSATTKQNIFNLDSFHSSQSEE